MKAFVLAVLFVFAGPARAEIFTVHPTPGVADFTSPAEALASPLVGAGDVLEVLPGTYAGTLLVDKPVLMVAVAGAEATVLDGAGSGPVVTITAGATLRGFTITGGAGFVSVGGVEIASAATVSLEANVIEDNHPIGDVGIPCGGVRISTGSSAVLTGNRIRANTSLSVGGLLAGGDTTVELFRNRIQGNGGSGTITGGVLFGASGRIVDTLITGNHGSGIGGLYVAGAAGPLPFGAAVDIVNCTIYGNWGASPMGSVGGLFLDDGGAVTVRNTLIHSNMGSVGGDVVLSSDFGAPPVAGFLDLDYAHVGTLGIGITPGPHMLPPFLDPMLQAPATATPFGPVFFGDFRPLAESPLVDAGLDLAFPADLPEVDLRGRVRFHGPAVDIGAFELSPRILPHPAPSRFRSVTTD